jgi:hypothetical protein
MLGKYRPKPSFLLEIAFLVGVWLLAWLVFDAPLAIIVFVIFAAYALVFLYENWLDNVSRRERSEERRSRRKEGEIFGSYKKPVESSPPRPAAAPSKPQEPEPAPATHSISERLSAKLHGREREEEKEAPVEQARGVSSIKPAPAPTVERDPFRAPPERVEPKEMRWPEPEPPRRREEPAPPAPIESAPRSVSEALRSPRVEPVAEQPHSLMAEIAAGPDARKASRKTGGWNIWELERLLAAQAKPDSDRDYERSMMLVYLREFADSDGQLPSQFDALVSEAFGDLVHGPAS